MRALSGCRQDGAAVVWSHATATDTVWSTVLSGCNAIVKIVTMIATSGTLQDLTGAMLWAEGGTPEVEIVIETVDNELLALRKALNSKEPRRYQDFLAPHAGGPHADGPAALDGHRRADGLHGP